jgi:hypothetical protein
LLGLAEGQSIDWAADDGVTHRIALEQVRSEMAAAR